MKKKTYWETRRKQYKKMKRDDSLVIRLIVYGFFLLFILGLLLIERGF